MLEAMSSGLFCIGCGIELPVGESAVHLDRHIDVVKDHAKGKSQSVTVVLRFCLPCAVKNMARIEEALNQELERIRQEDEPPPAA